jgi:hypothetical protein
MQTRRHYAILAGLLALLVWPAPGNAQTETSGAKEAWVAMAKGGFVVPADRRAVDLLVEMNALLSSPDPVLRDEVAYSAAARWILRDKALTPPELRRIRDRWLQNLEVGLGEAGTDTVFGRSFSALCLSLIAAADVQVPFLNPSEVHGLFDRLLDYFARERDLRGFDPARGWMHSVAHSADALKFLARNPALGPGTDARLLTAVRQKIESADAVLAWGENDRVARALHAAVRRADADPAALEAWTSHWVQAHRVLWANGPQVNPASFARVENATQVMRSLQAALSMDAAPTPNGTAAAKITLAALAKLR